MHLNIMKNIFIRRTFIKHIIFCLKGQLLVGNFIIQIMNNIHIKVRRESNNLTILFK